MIQARKLRHVIRLQAPSETLDDAGQPLDQWTTTHDNVRASVEPLSGREYVAAQQVHAEVSTRIACRWQPGMDETKRIVHVIDDGSPEVLDVYDIAGALPDPDSGQHWITFMCIKRISQGFRRGE